MVASIIGMHTIPKPAEAGTRPTGTFLGSVHRLVLVFVVAIAANLVVWGYLMGRIPWRQQAIPLRYNVYSGISLLGPPLQLLWLPLVGAGVVVVNAMAALVLRRTPLASFLLAGATVAAQLALGLAAWLILNFAT